MFQFWIQCNIYLLLPLLCVGLVMSYLCMSSERKIRRIWGWSGIVVTGAIGTPVHECSHLLMALLFGYRITEVKLFCPIQGKTTGILGYVKYRYSKTLLCKIGNFFVGIAPMIGGSVVIWLLCYLLLPDTVSWLQQYSADFGADMLAGSLRQMTGELLETFSGRIGELVVFLLLLIAISLHMSISRADLKGAIHGVIFLEIVLLLLSVAGSLLSWTGLFMVLGTLTRFLWLSLSIGLLAAVFTFVLIALIPSRA